MALRCFSENGRPKRDVHGDTRGVPPGGTNLSILIMTYGPSLMMMVARFLHQRILYKTL